MKRILTGAIAVLLLTPGVALAGHGKAGLWNVSTIMNMAMPPEVMAQMKKAGVAMPGARTIVSQVCMTQAQVDSDKPQTGANQTGCQTHIISQTASSMASDMVCSGQVKGSGHMQVSYKGAEHYTGSYTFKGDVQGSSSSMSTTFKGDWVKADCGAVKP